MLKTHQFIIENGLEALFTKFALINKRHKDYPNLLFLKYNQIDSPMSETIVQECRGLILDENDSWRVVSYPFKKFFNYGEGHASLIDWTSAKVFEKLDGSLCTLYFYTDKWQMATNGTPDGNGQVLNSNFDFAELFWKTFEQLKYELPQDIRKCYIFELMTPYNRVLVNHEKSRLALIGVRNLDTLLEEPIEKTKFGWECARQFPLQSLEDCINAAKNLNPCESEGYVIVDKNFNRVKVKSPQYVALSHIRDSFGPRRALEIVRTNEYSEFLAYFPDLTDQYESIRGKFDSLCNNLESYYQQIETTESQKEFALAAQQSAWSAPLFALRAGKCKSIRDFMANCSIGALEKIII